MLETPAETPNSTAGPTVIPEPPALPNTEALTGNRLAFPTHDRPRKLDPFPCQYPVPPATPTSAPRDLVSANIQQLMRAAVAQRLGAGRPPAPIQWLSDNGGIYTALETQIVAEQLHLVPITTPAYSPESNGMSEAFVWTLRRDYVANADLGSAAAVLAQLDDWFTDYNAVAPHSALGFKSPRQYRALIGSVVYPKSVS